MCNFIVVILNKLENEIKQIKMKQINTIEQINNTIRYNTKYKTLLSDLENPEWSYSNMITKYSRSDG